MSKIFNKRFIIIFLLSLTAVLLSLMLYIIISTTGIILTPKLSCNFKDKVYLRDFILTLDGSLENDHKIDTSVVGKKKLRIIYRNKYGFYKIKNFTIDIKDVTKPTILVNNDFVVNKGYDKKLEDVILCADDYDDDVDCSISGSYNMEEVGVYPLSMKATDKSNNTTIKNFNLNVVEPSDNKSNSSLEFVSYSDIYKKYKNNNSLIGIDISKWQEEVDFKSLKDNNVEFVIIKLGGQPDKGEDIVIDPYFKMNIESAIENDIKVGVYFYSYAGSVKEAREQALFVLDNIKGYKIDLPISFDWENWKSFNSFNISLNTLNNIAKSFMNEIKNNGYKSNLYSSEYYLENIWFGKEYKNIWLANYGKVKYSGKYDMWQLCSDGKVDGINSYVDIDVLYLN